MKGFLIIFCIIFSSCAISSLDLGDYLLAIGEDQLGDSLTIDAVAVAGMVYKSEDGTKIWYASDSKIFQDQSANAYFFVGPRISGKGKDYIYTRNGQYYGLRIFTPIQIGFTVAQSTSASIPWDSTDPTKITILFQE
ncbi:MAG: hypothetical protein ACRC9L_02500 [Brevinema sp.]